MQFDWPTAFWPITWDPKLCQICWWNINNNISFHYRLFPRKTNITKFFKKSQNPILGPFWALLPKLGPKMNFPRKNGSASFSISIYLPLRQKSEKPNEPFLRKLLERHTKNQFISLISLWDTANFRVLWLIEKSCNLIGQEHFGPYLRNQNFPKYEICSSIQELQ